MNEDFRLLVCFCFVVVVAFWEGPRQIGIDPFHSAVNLTVWCLSSLDNATCSL